MILTGPEIEARVSRGDIVITPYDPSQVGPNSVNLTLGPVLRVYRAAYGTLDTRREAATDEIVMPAAGYVLQPDVIYLASTVERTESPGLVPMVHGRSSLGRLGLFVHVTAGFGDTGFRGHWTLELVVVEPLRIYPGDRVCQIAFHEVVGELRAYAGKYQDQPASPVASLLHTEARP